MLQMAAIHQRALRDQRKLDSGQRSRPMPRPIQAGFYSSYLALRELEPMLSSSG
jgi:hypothetical protein